MKEQEVEIGNSILFEFQRYVRGEMTKREEFTFQKNIRKDLYAEAAIEGFNEVQEEEPSFFTNLAEEEEEKRMRNRKRLIYSLVASVIILIVATSAYLVVEKKIDVRQFRPFKFLNSSTPAFLKVVTDQAQIAGFQAFESLSQISIPDIKTVPALPDATPDPSATTGPADSPNSGGDGMIATTTVSDTAANLPDATVNASATVPADTVSGTAIQIKADTTAAVTPPENIKAPLPQ